MPLVAFSLITWTNWIMLSVNGDHLLFPSWCTCLLFPFLASLILVDIPVQYWIPVVKLEIFVSFLIFVVNISLSYWWGGFNCKCSAAFNIYYGCCRTIFILLTPKLMNSTVISCPDCYNYHFRFQWKCLADESGFLQDSGPPWTLALAG